MIALDTNLLIHACDRADTQRQQIAIDLIAKSKDGVLLWQVACEFIAASRKLRRAAEFAGHSPLVTRHCS